MSDTTFNLIKAIAAGDAMETEAAFNASMAEKISVKLDDMRMNIAQNMFNTPEAVVEEKSSEEDEDDEEKDEDEDKKDK